MNRLLIVAILIIGTLPLYAQSQQPNAAELAQKGCNAPAPFCRSNGEPYLEPHHIRRLADGGPDHPQWVSAVCPACHREIHYGENGRIKNDKLREKIVLLETEVH
jgi:hypothetical protein